MSRPQPADLNGDAVPASAAARILERASMLDVARKDDIPVARLQAAATEAGISSLAFADALAEFRAVGSPRMERDDPPARRRWVAGAGLAVVLATGVLATTWQRSGAVAAPAARTVEEGVLLHCLAAGDAAELVRPLLADPMSTVTFNPTVAPRVLVVRTTSEKLARVKALLTAHDATGAGACATGSPPAL